MTYQAEENIHQAEALVKNLKKSAKPIFSCKPQRINTNYNQFSKKRFRLDPIIANKTQYTNEDIDLEASRNSTSKNEDVNINLPDNISLINDNMNMNVHMNMNMNVVINGERNENLNVNANSSINQNLDLNSTVNNNNQFQVIQNKLQFLPSQNFHFNENKDQQELNKLFSWVLHLHPLYDYKIKKCNNPVDFMKLARSYAHDPNNSDHIIKLLDIRDFLYYHSNSSFKLTFSQFVSIGPLILNNYVILSKYYKIQKKTCAYANTMKCRFCEATQRKELPSQRITKRRNTACKHRVRMIIDFKDKEVILNFQGDHTGHLLDDYHRFQSAFVRGLFTSAAQRGFTSAAELLKTIKSIIGSDLTESQQQIYQSRLGLSTTKLWFVSNILDKYRFENPNSLAGNIGVVNNDRKTAENRTQKPREIVWRLDNPALENHEYHSIV